MGVPGFYRWAVRKVHGLRKTTSDPPYEFDNLYLDFNGVVHGCVEEWQDDEDRLFESVEAQLALILAIVQPLRLLFVALDGVAPRAKMNQQRSRRFRAAQEAELNANTIEGALKTFDRNAITPGTAFMVRLSERLEAWAQANAAAAHLLGVTVVISGDRDPGEGEHKIMDVIRKHPDLSHCLCSNDADLVFLGLVSNAERVSLLRTRAPDKGKVRCDSQDAPAAAPASEGAQATEADSLDPDSGAAVGSSGGLSFSRLEWSRSTAVGAIEEPSDGETCAQEAPTTAGPVSSTPQETAVSEQTRGAAWDYELLSVIAIRDWLAGRFPACEKQRLARDFVALCCLAGNDFLPHMEAVDIYSGGLDKVLRAYERIRPAQDGYLISESSSLVLPRWQSLLEEFAQDEAETMLSMFGLGLGRKMPPYRGPGPPRDSWDGLSVLVTYVPGRAVAADVRAALSKQSCTVASVHATTRRGAWLVRFTDARSAVLSLVSVRRVWTSKVAISWTVPSEQSLAEPPSEPFEATEWLAELEALVVENFEFWLGPKNLPNDDFLRRHVRMRRDRYVPIRLLASFHRMKCLMQDIGRIAEILHRSELLEVSGEGDEAMVRAVADVGFRSDEGAEHVERQEKAMACLAAGDYMGTVLALRDDYYARRSGPGDGGPLLADEDVTACDRLRSRAFLVGIEWVLRYYVHGCPSWSWFYPAHYPPLCASLAVQARSAASGDGLEPPPLHAPFPPELQLLAVLPPQCAHLLPEPLRHLLTDQSSPVIEFYPREFDVFLKDGDKEWQAIVLLPFVDEARLRAALDAVPWNEHSAVRLAQAFLVDNQDAGRSVRCVAFCKSDALPEGRLPTTPAPTSISTAARAQGEQEEDEGGKGGGRRRRRKDKGGGRGSAKEEPAQGADDPKKSQEDAATGSEDPEKSKEELIGGAGALGAAPRQEAHTNEDRDCACCVS